MSNLHQGVEVLHEVGSVNLPEGQTASKNAQTFTDRLLPWLELHRDTPFFVFLHVLDPHPPFETYAPYDAQFADPAWRDEQYADGQSPAVHCVRDLETARDGQEP